MWGRFAWAERLDQHVVTYKVGEPVTAANVAAVRAQQGLKPGQAREGHF